MTQKTGVISIKHSRDGTVIELSTILYIVAVEIVYSMWSPGLENITIGIRVIGLVVILTSSQVGCVHEYYIWNAIESENSKSKSADSDSMNALLVLASLKRGPHNFTNPPPPHIEAWPTYSKSSYPIVPAFLSWHRSAET